MPQDYLDLEQIPSPLRAGLAQHIERLRARPELLADIERQQKVAESLTHVWACSDYVATSCLRQPQLLRDLLESNRMLHSMQAGEYAATAPPRAGDCDQPTIMRSLREWRRRESVRIAWRDIAGWAPLEETLADLTALADVAIGVALQYCVRAMAGRYGEPQSPDGERLELIVLAMGKLGGGELNFSSDIDLVLLYPGAGQTDGAQVVDNEIYFTRLAQQLIRLLGSITEDGFVYRVDTRLRPFGDSGPLVVSLGALESYLVRHGRDWERYAFIKARIVAGRSYGDLLYRQIIRPFVYRRYLDYGVFEALREMKATVSREVRQQQLQNHIKSGPGGIREIEFIVQSFQLIRGGSNTDLQTRELQSALTRLVRFAHIGAQVAAELNEAYRFLRLLENRLQQMDEQQLHSISADPLIRARLAFGLGYSDWPQLDGQIRRHRDWVQGHFNLIVFGVDQDKPAGEEESWSSLVWATTGSDETSTRVLEQHGFADPGEVLVLLDRVRHGALYRRLDESGRRRLNTLMPALLQALVGSSKPVAALRRLVRIVESVGRRSAYFALLNENPAALQRLVDLCGYSEFLAQQIATSPLLLDELLDPRIFEEPPSRARLDADLQRRFASLQRDDIEKQVDALRTFQQAAVFHVAVADLSGLIPLMKVSDRLTEVAELVLEQALTMAWEELTDKPGVPLAGLEARDSGFAVVAYGKLGGLELGYGSDLDLVFVHDADPARYPASSGMEPPVLFARLARRLVHHLTIQTQSGILYEVDTRLRPSGRSGLIVSSLSAFERYQRSDAWTWEHQALLRSRAVAGDVRVKQSFERIRREVLGQSMDHDKLAGDVRDMRARMRSELSRSKEHEFDIKQDTGGLADIEFLVQYWVIDGAHRHPSLLEFSDNIRQLEALAAAGLVTSELAERLADVYRAYRRRAHRLALGGQSAVVADSEFVAERSDVERNWDAVFG